MPKDMPSQRWTSNRESRSSQVLPPPIPRYPLSQRQITLDLAPFVPGTAEHESILSATGAYRLEAFSTEYLRISHTPRSPLDFDRISGTLTLSDPFVLQCRDVMLSPQDILYDRRSRPIREALNTYSDIDNYLGVHAGDPPPPESGRSRRRLMLDRLPLLGRLLPQRPPRASTGIEIAVPVLLFFDHYHFNFTHFLVEAYPLLYALREHVPALVPLLPCIAAELHDPDRSYILSCLQALGISAESCISLHKSAHFSIKSLTLPTQVKMHPRHVVPAIEHLADYYRSNNDPGMGERIFISRENARARKLSNGHEVEALLARHGFRKVVMEQLTFREKVNVMSRARSLVCSDSSSVTNAVFMPRGARILAFRTQLFPNYNVVLSALFGHHFRCQVCPFATDDRSWVTGDIHVDLRRLEENLQSLA